MSTKILTNAWMFQTTLTATEFLEKLNNFKEASAKTGNTMFVFPWLEDEKIDDEVYGKRVLKVKSENYINIQSVEILWIEAQEDLYEVTIEREYEFVKDQIEWYTNRKQYLDKMFESKEYLDKKDELEKNKSELKELEKKFSLELRKEQAE